MTEPNDVWALASEFSNRVQLLDDLRTTERALREARTTCGSCFKWMKRSCPREVHDNTIGRSRGPSCAAIKCGEFVMSPRSEADALRAEARIAELRQRL